MLRILKTAVQASPPPHSC